MSGSEFHAPTIETMNTLLPAFDFGEIMTSNELGAVYFAIQKSLERQVALKIFSPVLGQDKDFKKSFEKSAQSVAGLRHPRLIGFFDSGTVEQMPYIVMEFVPGKSLARSTQGKVIEFSQSMAIIEGVCEGIAYAHENNVVHGNLDTMNILLNQMAEPKIGNFGLSRSVHTASDSEIPAHFTAPEVLSGGEPDKASDVYSIAAIFYELITGHAYSQDAPLASSLTSSPPAVDEILREATALDPSERTDDASEFLSKLKRSSGRSGPRTAVSLKPAKPSGARTGGPPASGPNRPTRLASAGRSTGSGYESNLFLKIIVIVILLIAVQQLWSYLKVVREDRDRENQEIVEEQKAAKDKAIAEARAKREQEIEEQRKASAENRTPGTPQVPQRSETSMESLDRLGSSLKAGRRSEMPVGSIGKGDSSFFLVTKPMTWVDAAAFAEEHGGHLALPDSDLSWLPDELTKDRSFWVGAARSGKDAWALVDASLWNPSTGISGNELFVFLDESGNYKTANARKIQPFVIQWRMDGSNPATLKKQLATIAASIKSSKPIFPPGTIAVGERRYLHVSRPVKWEEAQQIAKSAGGNLLVISSEEEAAQVEKITDDLKVYPEIWAGGYLKDNTWFWITNEPWNGAEWIKEGNATQSDSAMVVRPGKGWDAMRKRDTASGFIIEWSDDPSTNKGSSGGTSAPNDAAGELAAKAREIVIAADKRRTGELRKNIEKLKWDLDAHIKGMNRGESALWSPEAEKLKSCVKNDRLYRETIANERVSISPHMDRLVSFQLRKQEEADQQFAKEVGIIRDSYVAKLQEFSDQAKAAGQIKVHKDTLKMIDEAKNLQKWIKSFGVVLEPEKPKIIERIFDDRFERRYRD